MNTTRPRRGRAQSTPEGARRKTGTGPARGAGPGRGDAAAAAKPSPAALAREVARRLAAEADPAAARQFLTYFKPHEQVRVFGVRTTRVREILAEVHRRVRGSWALRDAVAFTELCVKRRELELRGIGTALLGRYTKVYEACLLHRVQRWLVAGYLDNWASVDAMAGNVVAPLLARFPSLVPELTGWSASRNLWARRMAVVPLVPFARHGEHLDAAYRVVESLLGDPEDLLHKATGWLLREAGKTDVPRLERFLLRHGAAVPRTTLRYAIERFPAARRKRLLEATRTAPAGTRG
jgi:3-methyladenine DNA glycosylase AlkD